MVKFKTHNQVVNRGGKRYIAKDGVIEVSKEDAVHFTGFEEVKPAKQVKDKKTKNENNKQDS